MLNENRTRPLGTSQDYIASLPEEVYDTSESSHVVKLMMAVCGDGGVGTYRKQLFMNRLQMSLDTLRFAELDRLFSGVIRFPRLQVEAYTFDPTIDLLTEGEWSSVLLKDSAYRERIRKFLQAVALGGTLEGLRLVASASLGVECVAFEARMFYESQGIVEGEAMSKHFGLISPSAPKANYQEVLIVPLIDGEVTPSMRRLVTMATDRVRPQDTIVSVVSSEQFIAMFPDDYWGTAGTPTLRYADEVTIVGVPTTSSDFFTIRRKVTGRGDWTLSSTDSWIVANEEKQAPQMAFSQHQEESFDNTSQVISVTSSSNHTGLYDHQHKKRFSYLQDASAQEIVNAKQALRRYGTKRISASYYGG